MLIEKNITIEEEEDDLSSPPDDEELDEVASFDPPRHRYYQSEKVLGKLYRDIDEYSFLANLQTQSRSAYTGDESLIDKVWQYVQSKAALIQWSHHLGLAGNIKEKYSNPQPQVAGNC